MPHDGNEQPRERNEQAQAPDASYGRKRALRAAKRAADRETMERREKAEVAKAIADMRIMRRRAEQMHSNMVERDAAQAAINDLVSALQEWLRAIGGGREAIMADLGDLMSEALRVTR